MTYELLVSCIFIFGGKPCSHTGELIRVQAAQLLSGQYSLEGETYYNPDFLYVGYVSELPADPRKAPHDAVCIEDVPVPEAYRDCGLVNLVLAEKDADLLQLYNCVVFNLADDTRILNHGLFFAEIDREGLSLSGLMNLAHRRLNNPVLLVSANHRLIGWSQNARFRNPELVRQIEEQRLTDAQMEQIRKNNIYPIYLERGAVTYPEQLPPGEKWAVLPVKVHGFAIAWLLVSNAETMFFGSDFFFIGKLRDLLAELMEGETDLYSDAGLMHSSLFMDLISDGGDRALLAERIRFLGWRFTENMYLLVTGQHGMGGMELIGEVQRISPGCRYLVYGEETILLVDLPEEEYAERTGALRGLLKRHGLRGALSGRFSAAWEMADRCRQARHLRELGVQLGEKDALLTYERFAPYFLAEAVHSTLRPADYFPGGFAELAAYDEQHSAGLIETLELYLYYVGLPQEAISELCVSKSTAYYRLSKIKELCRLDLENGAVRTQLAVAVAAYKLYGRDI